MPGFGRVQVVALRCVPILPVFVVACQRVAAAGRRLRVPGATVAGIVGTSRVKAAGTRTASQAAVRSSFLHCLAQLQPLELYLGLAPALHSTGARPHMRSGVSGLRNVGERVRNVALPCTRSAHRCQ